LCVRITPGALLNANNLSAKAIRHELGHSATFQGLIGVFVAIMPFPDKFGFDGGHRRVNGSTATGNSP
jgi:hypothetical protein